MVTLAEGKLLWTPREEFKRASHMARYMDWLANERGLVFADYDALWRWSVEDLDAFWESICGYSTFAFISLTSACLPRVTCPVRAGFPGRR